MLNLTKKVMTTEDERKLFYFGHILKHFDSTQVTKIDPLIICLGSRRTIYLIINFTATQKTPCTEDRTNKRAILL